MDIQFNFELEDQLLLAVTAGHWRSQEDNVAMCKAIGEVAQRHERERVLWLDDTLGRSLSVLELHVTGEAAADAFRGSAIAYVPRYQMNLQIRQRLDFAEAVAKNRGLRVQVCQTEADARDWLASLSSSYFAICGW